MKYIYLPLLFVAFVLTSCTKTNTTTNNTVVLTSSQPAFAVQGLKDVSVMYMKQPIAALGLTVQYLDSAQESTTLTVSGLPEGITMDTNWVSTGVPTFSTTLTLSDTSAVAAQPGTYPITVTATTTSGRRKYYNFNLKVLPVTFLGRYDSCNQFCSSSTGVYKDSVYLDPATPHVIWFSNFANSGYKGYAVVNVIGSLDIPSQTVGPNTYSGTGSIVAPHRINYSISSSCGFNMY